MEKMGSRGSVAFSASSGPVAVYKGLTVAVYSVDKTEINLTGQDLVELVNVCSLLPIGGDLRCLGVPTLNDLTKYVSINDRTPYI